jgi:hypothetical protein
MHRTQPHRTIRWVPAIIAAAVIIAGCGSSSRSNSSTVAGRAATPANRLAQAVRFSDCMRSHGVSNFPDPGQPKDVLTKSEVNSPQFQAAQSKCVRLAPPPQPESAATQRARRTAALAFARCVRTHGFPSFPDPTPAGRLTPEMATAAGINLHQPGVLQAGYACVGVTHGFLTRAAIARAVNGSG